MPRFHLTSHHLRLVLLLIAYLAIVLLAACGGGGDSPAPTTPTTPTTPKVAAVATVVVTLASSSVVAGQGTTASAETRDANGAVLSGRAVDWNSSNTAVATVNAAGSVASVAPGSVSITATSEGRSGSATLTVTAVPVANVQMSADSIDIPIRSTTTVQANPRSASGQVLTGRTVTWQSSSPTIATVSTSGVVSMLLPGTATITATCEGQTGSVRVRGSIVSLTRIVDSIRQAGGVPAMGVIVVTREGVAAIGVAGTRRINGSVPVTTSDQWHIGSDLKAITAILAGIAVDAGVLSFDRTVEQAFPEFATTMRAEFKTVTLRELLGHVSGMQNTLDGLSNAATNLPGVRSAWMSYALKQPPNNARGTYYYSNTGYGAAGSMIERAWGGSYEDLFFSKLLQPLGITSAGWGPTTVAGGMDQPVGHMLVNGAWVPCEACDNPPASSPIGRMHMSLEAWGRIIQELLLADQGRSTLLRQATARALTTVVAPAGGTPYAQGWIVTNATAGSRLVTHDGSNNANHSRATVALDAGVAFLININAADLPSGLTGNILTNMNARMNVFWATGR